MCRYNIVSRILLILAVSTFALTAPVLVQEKCEACVDDVHIPGDVITVLGKRALGEDLIMLWEGPWRFGNVWGEPEAEAEDYEPPPNLFMPVPAVHAPQPNLPFIPVPEGHAPPPDLPFPHVVDAQAPPPNLVEAPLPEAPMLPHDPADFDRESMVFDDDAPPPGSPESGHSDSPPTSQEWSTESEDWYTPASSPRAESSTESNSDSDH